MAQILDRIEDTGGQVEVDPPWFEKFLSYLDPKDEYLNRFAAIPLPLRLDAHPDFTGQGVTIAFLDSDYQLHPDLADRVRAFHDAAGEREDIATEEVLASQWHGTQTCVVCAGDGTLSKGAYCGLASRADLVLVKTARNGGVEDECVLEGLRWVRDNAERYDIRLVNMSLGCSREDPEFVEALDEVLRDLDRMEVLCLAAAGNEGFGPDPRVKPPADSPYVLTVGGYSDENTLDPGVQPYSSNHGTARDETVVKPEVLAPAAWVAAPLLVGSELYYRAAVLSKLDRVPDFKLKTLITRLYRDLGREDELDHVLAQDLRARIHHELRSDKIVAEAYQHVDGTSFATPIVTSVAAQMLQANPRLHPAELRALLVLTAVPLLGMPRLFQGYGVVHPRRAVERALERTPAHVEFTGRPRLVGDQLVFHLVGQHVDSIHLVGELNGWNPTSHPFEELGEDRYRLVLPAPPAGTFRYKLVLDGERWIEDPYNPLREPDGVGGFNSLLFLDSAELI